MGRAVVLRALSRESLRGTTPNTFDPARSVANAPDTSKACPAASSASAVPCASATVSASAASSQSATTPSEGRQRESMVPAAASSRLQRQLGMATSRRLGLGAGASAAKVARARILSTGFRGMGKAVDDVLDTSHALGVPALGSKTPVHVGAKVVAESTRHQPGRAESSAAPAVSVASESDSSSDESDV
jgi:hypothetical protein